MSSKETREMIESYVEAYNSFDVEGMTRLLHNDILFRNFSSGRLDTETRGIQKFQELAENSSKMFSSRRQRITEFSDSGKNVEVHVDYEGILAVDFPNGLKAGDKIELKGKSVFEISEGKISLIEDYS
ncbi:nuclear transport factor 2 family protein [Domibacillus indicus]|uniref:nuclear transport factor 2 family protein n=1 Tax=Domibacillus indicus TaxID=1437523 RepID=UPI000617EB5F|nr:nuclear transport factor 2 family protein [Domibacillus indicus]